MGDSGNDSLLVKIAVFGITVSVICSIGITILLVPSSDYSSAEIAEYRKSLVDFSGESMINQSPWVLKGVYTPWNSSVPIEGHLDPDGWLYGESIEYPEIGKSADIRLDVNQKSSVPLAVNEETPSVTIATGKKWWTDTGIFSPITSWIGTNVFGQDENVYTTYTGTIYNYTGYRYVWDPTLPFSEGEAVKDGSLSLVWYSYSGSEGLSGGLQIYGGDVLISNIAAVDIISGYSSVSGIATNYDFVFEGVHLTLSVRFDQNIIDSGAPLMQAWTAGQWSMAISAKSAGNFLDVDGSSAFAYTAGSVIDTFIDIFTFSLPSINNAWMDLVLWLMVGLPMSVAMLCITLRTVSAFKIF